jgi:hypothetical protein
MTTSNKPKEISQAHAKGQARDLLAGLAGASVWQESLSAFEALSAGNRRTVIEAMAQALGGTPKTDPARLSAFAMTAIRVGRSTRSDFAATLIQSVIDLCSAFGTEGAMACSNVLAALLGGTDVATKEGLPDSTELDFGRLAKSAAAGPALSDLLEDVRYKGLLRVALPSWGRLVAALVALRGAGCGIRPTAAAAILKLISDPKVPLPVEIVLSANWLCQIAGGVPEELARRSPFQFLLHSAGAGEAQRPEAKPNLPQQTTPAPTSRRGKLLSGIESLMREFESEMEQRRAVLSGEVSRLGTELAAREKELEKARSEVFDLRRDLLRSREEKQTHQDEIKRFAEERQQLGKDVEKWRKEAEVLLDSRNNQIEQAKSECRRDFTKAAGTNLKSLRGFLLELRASDRSAPASMAATAMDEIIRVLHRQQFVSPEELPRLQ